VDRWLIRESAAGLMDAAWPEDEQAILQRVLDEFRAVGATGEIDFHAIRTRSSASRRFVSFHILVRAAGRSNTATTWSSGWRIGSRRNYRKSLRSPISSPPTIWSRMPMKVSTGRRGTERRAAADSRRPVAGDSR